MNCPYCGEVIENNETFCPKCGNRLINHNITTNYEISDTKELATYIDKNVNKIMSRKFSFPSLFFGSLYYLYRKMYLLAIVIISLSLVYVIGINYVSDDYKIIFSLVYLIASVLINIIIAIKFNSFYISQANKKINKIKNKNKDKTNFEIMEKIKYSGSTNLLAPALAILIIAIINSYVIYKQNNIVDNLSNAKYNVFDLSGETDALIELNEDGSFVWYSNKNNKQDNFYVGNYKVYIGNNAINEAKKYKLYTDRIKDKNSYYILKLSITRSSINGVLNNSSQTLIYYGLYDSNSKSIDLSKVGNRDYFRLVKTNE